MAEREYLVSSTVKVTGEAVIKAKSAKEAVEKGLGNDPDFEPKFYFSDGHSETVMRARLLPSGVHKPASGSKAND